MKWYIFFFVSLFFAGAQAETPLETYRLLNTNRRDLAIDLLTRNQFGNEARQIESLFTNRVAQEHYEEAGVHLKDGRYELAKDLFRQSLTKDRFNVKTTLALVQTLWLLHQPDAALQLIDEWQTEIGPQSQLKTARWITLCLSADWQICAKISERFTDYQLPLNPAPEILVDLFAYAHFKLDDEENAEKWLARSITHFSKTPTNQTIQLQMLAHNFLTPRVFPLPPRLPEMAYAWLNFPDNFDFFIDRIFPIDDPKWKALSVQTGI